MSKCASTSEELAPRARRPHAVWGVRPWVQTAMHAATLGLVTVLAVICFGLGDRLWWSECVALWPPFLWGLGLVPMALLTFHPRRLRRFGLTLGAAVLFPLLSTDWRPLVRRESHDLRARFEALRQSTDGGVALRVATWNIASHRTGPEEVLAALRSLGPDVCALQEARDLLDAPPGLLGAFPHGLFGEEFALMSRWPVIDLHTPPEFARSVQTVRLELPDFQSVLLVNVHLPMPGLPWRLWINTGMRDFPGWHRLRAEFHEALAAHLARTVAAESPDAVVITGDFNVDGAHGIHRPLGAHARDVWPMAGLGWIGSYHARLPLARLDQTWVSDAITPVSARIIRLSTSDHRALVTDLILERPSRPERPGMSPPAADPSRAPPPLPPAAGRR